MKDRFWVSFSASALHRLSNVTRRSFVAGTFGTHLVRARGIFTLTGTKFDLERRPPPTRGTDRAL